MDSGLEQLSPILIRPVDSLNIDKWQCVYSYPLKYNLLHDKLRRLGYLELDCLPAQPNTACEQIFIYLSMSKGTGYLALSWPLKLIFFLTWHHVRHA